jgi:hypothetical protein
MLTVSPQLQNGGIGAQLLAQSDLHAKQLGFLKNGNDRNFYGQIESPTIIEKELSILV